MADFRDGSKRRFRAVPEGVRLTPDNGHTLAAFLARRSAAGQVICPSGFRRGGLSSPSRKNILFFRSANHLYISRHSVPLKGALAIVTTRGGDAVDADGTPDEGIGCGRRRRVVLTPQWLASSWRKSASDGVNKARSPGRARYKL
jgi:hypothetical protein